MSKHMHEVRCANVDQNPAWAATASMFCNVHWLVKEEDVEETTSRRCYNCNSNEWNVTRTNLSEKDYFKKVLEGQDTIGYSAVDFTRNVYTETFIQNHTPWNKE